MNQNVLFELWDIFKSGTLAGLTRGSRSSSENNKCPPYMRYDYRTALLIITYTHPSLKDKDIGYLRVKNGDFTNTLSVHCCFCRYLYFNLSLRSTVSFIWYWNFMVLDKVHNFHPVQQIIFMPYLIPKAFNMKTKM